MWILCGEAVAYLILYYRKFLLSSQVICIGSAYFLQKLSSVVLCGIDMHKLLNACTKL